MTCKTNRLLPAAALAAIGLIVQACSSGSGGSSVGHQAQIPPTARVQVLNGGTTNVFREGSEVLLTGKDSEDADGPLLAWSWKQTSGPVVRLIQRNKTTYSFTAPHVTADTKLTFALTVTDSESLTNSASVDVTVVPAEDPDSFLQFDVGISDKEYNTFDRFQVVPALAQQASTDSTPKPFTLSVKAYIVYPPHSNPNIDCPISSTDFAGGVPTTTSSGCLVELLEDLTPGSLPGGGTGIQGEWPANVPAVPSGSACQLQSGWWNSRYNLKMPRLDVGDFNQQFVDSGNRGRMLDQFNTPNAHIVLSFSLTAPQNQQDATLIIMPNAQVCASTSSLPVVLAPSLVTNSGTGLPTTDIMPLQQVLNGIEGRESNLTGQVYYRTVDPGNTRTTLNAWLKQAGFASDDKGTLLPAAVAGTGEFAHAIYLNNYDLGFGRNMYTRTDQYGNVYAFVGNYRTLEGAIRAGPPFATVAMEYSPLNNAADSSPKFVKFFTYVDDGSGDSRRVTSLNFDGRGELFTPGNCIACHGGAKPPGTSELVYNNSNSTCNMLDPACYSWPATNRNGVDISNGDLKATFLPWDVSALLFADTDPAIQNAPTRFDGLSLANRLIRDYGDYSEGKQEAQLKKLNQAAYSTYCNVSVTQNCQTDAARRLVEHWYGGVDQNGKLVASKFDDSTAIEGWKNGETVSTPTSADPGATTVNPDTAASLYHDVYAHHCRMCHTNIFNPLIRFDNYQKLAAEATGGDKSVIADGVFHRGVMPNARLTDDRFWVSFADGKPTAAEELAKEFGIQPVNGQLSPTASAKITGLIAQVARHDTVRLSGANSSFADSYAWTVQYQPPSALASNPAVAGFKPALVGASSSELAFAADEPGTYSIQLTINGAEGAPVVSQAVEVNVPDNVPAFDDLPVQVVAGTSATFSVLDELDTRCMSVYSSPNNCPQVFGDAPSTIAVDVSGWDNTAGYGSLTLNDAATGTITIDASSVTTPSTSPATIPFSVTDVDGETLTHYIDVSVLAPLAANDDPNETVCAQTTILNDNIPTCNEPSVTTAGTRHVTINVLGNDSSPSPPLALHSYTQPVPAGSGTVTQSGDQLVFTPTLGFTGQATFQYDAIDSAANVTNMATVTVQVTPTTYFDNSVNDPTSYVSTVQKAFSNAGCASSACHDSGGVDITSCDLNPISNPNAPNWANWSDVNACVSTSSPRTSGMLTWPNNSSHGGFMSFTGTWAENSDANFDAVLRWIEEGANNNTRP